MTINDAYDRFVTLVNKNSINDNVAVSKPKFVTLFNDSQNKFIDWSLEKLNQKDRRLIQEIVVTNYKLTEYESLSSTTTFSLPSNYYENSNVNAFASNDTCNKQPMKVDEVKSENISHLLSDSNSKPSFKYREGFYIIADSKVVLYKDNFEYSDVYLDYYRKPTQVDIEGYINAEGYSSKNTDPEFSDRAVQRILLIAAKDFNINNENLEKIQVDNNRIISKF